MKPCLEQLKAAVSLGQLAVVLGVKPGMLSYLLYKKSKKDLYKRFDIPKRHGGVREILAPESGLKLLQHRLSNILQECQKEINASHGHAEDGSHFGVAHGFKRHHTIMTNGRQHVARRYVFNVDLYDFFGCINFGRVRGYFIKDKNFNLNEDVATVIAQIACHDNKLPQGSPCSPVISNLIGHSLDIHLSRLAASAGATYTRYADDLTFSTNKSEFPKQIARKVSEHKWEPGKALKRIVLYSGFSFNPSKTRMQYCDSRQEVTGLTVNRKVNVPATYRYTVRAMVDRLFNTGEFQFVYKKLDEDGKATVKKSKGCTKQLLGMLSYIDQVYRYNQKIREDNALPTVARDGRISLFRRFVYFDTFFAAGEPIVVCEGKTDNVYLKCAIKSLAAFYPSLAEPGSPPKLKIRFFKYSERLTSKITELSGGVGGICKLLKYYHEDITTKFKAPISKHPIIVLIDNDAGANSIYEAIAGITKKTKPAGRADFIHVVGNLYVVPTPLLQDRDSSCIEDFFDSATLAAPLNGKTFSREKSIDESRHFGKAPFALKVIAKNAATVDFSGFKGILDRVVKVIEDYKLKR